MTNPITKPPKQSLFSCWCCSKKKKKDIDTRIQTVVPKSYDHTRFKSTEVMTMSEMLQWNPDSQSFRNNSDEKVAQISRDALHSNGAVV